MTIGQNKITMDKIEKIYSYPISMFIKFNDNTTFQYETQLYQIGVYITINNNPRLQFNLTPQRMERFVNKILKDDNIKSINEGRIVNVQKVDGFLKEVEI